MAILKEVSESEAAELFGSKLSQDRQADLGDDNETGSNESGLDEVLRRISDFEYVLPQSPGEGGRGSDRTRGQPGLENEIRPDSSADAVDEQRESKGKKPGAGEAVLLGALSTGVNGPTWFVIKAVLAALAASLVLLLHVAIKSSSTMVIVNVIFLIIITGGLALGLSWYVSQIGLVTVEKQMAELNLTDGASEAATMKTE